MYKEKSGNPVYHSAKPTKNLIKLFVCPWTWYVCWNYFKKFANHFSKTRPALKIGFLLMIKKLDSSEAGLSAR
jgi:hypothetical protein